MYAVRPFNKSSVCIKENIGHYEISLAFDDSCGALSNLSRGDIRIYDNNTDKDVTARIMGTDDTIVADFANFALAVHLVTQLTDAGL